LDIALQQAWRERRRLSRKLGVKALALAAIFRAGEAVGARKAERRRRWSELLAEEVEPDPLDQQDDEDFWQSYELAYPRNAEVFSGAVNRPPEAAANDDVLLMHEVHGVPLAEIALALAIPPAEAAQLLASARRRLRRTGNITS
jgi:DNA-directed RNA polymerase specialized sigma24 family protein